MVFMTVSAAYTTAAALAGAATVAELSRAGRSMLEILGLRKADRTMLHAAERTFNCHLWMGFTWRPCVLGMAGDLLILSGRFVEEARLMESAHVSVQDFYASVALLVGDPLQLCFQSAEEAQSFATEVRQRACLKKDMLKLADQAKDLRESLSSATLSSDRSNLRQKSEKAEKELQMTAALRTHLAVPKGVPMYTLSPCASGDLEKLDEMRLRTPPSNRLGVPKGVPMYTLTPCASGDLDELDETRLLTPSFKAAAPKPAPVPPLSLESSTTDLQEIPKLKIHRANSCPSPSKLQQLNGSSSTGSLEPARRDGNGDGSGERLRLRRHSETPEGLSTSPRDPESFASKVFMGLGLDSAKASLVAQKRVDVLKTKFEGSKGTSGCSSSPVIASSR